MKKIITVQHTQSVHHVNGMVGGWTDWDLTELGREQAENIGRKLSKELDGQEWVIYSSDLKRAAQTAEPIARYMGIEIQYSEALREINSGDSHGKSREWAKANQNNSAIGDFDGRLFKGAETWREFWARIEGAARVLRDNEAQNIIIVAHGGTLAVFQRVWCGAEICFPKFGKAGSVSYMNINDMTYIEG
jgi:probable phosphoglycerate mutase